MPTAKCRVKHNNNEKAGSRRRLEERSGLPPLPQAPAAHVPSVSPWAPKNYSSERNLTPEPTEHGRMSPSVQAAGEGSAGAKPKGWDPKASVAKPAPANSAFLSAHDLGVRMGTLRRQETQNLKAKAAYAKSNPKSVPLWFFEKYKVITNS